MTTKKILSRVAIVRLVFAAAVALSAVGLGFATRGLLAGEAREARAFVAEGERAIARNERPAAIVDFERARWVAPRADFVRAALRSVDVPDAERLFPRVLRFVTAREWSALATLFGWICGLGVVFVALRWRAGRAGRWALAGAGGFMVAMVGLFASNVSSPAIVTGAQARVRVAPYANAAAAEVLTAGSMVVTGPRYGAFVQVRDKDGQTGWLPRSDLETIAVSGDAGG